MIGIVAALALALSTLGVLTLRPRLNMLLALFFTAAATSYVFPGVGAIALSLSVGLLCLTPPFRSLLRRSFPPTEAAVLAVFIALTSGARSLWDHATVHALIAAAAQVLLLVFVLADSQRTSQRITSVAMLYYANLFLIALLFAGGITGREWIDCRAEFDKCTAVGKIYSGVFESENVLALFTTVVLILTFLVPRYTGRNFHRMVLISIILLTGSRAPLVAMIAGATFAAALMLTAKRPQRHAEWRIPSMPLTALIGTASLAAVLLTRRATGGAFSNRGYVWSEIWARLDSSWVSGIGLPTFRDLSDAGHFRGHYPHSQYLLMFVAGGLALVIFYVFFLIAIGRSLRAPRRCELFRPLWLLCFVTVYGSVETLWNPASLDPYVWLIVVLIAVAGEHARDDDRPEYRDMGLESV